MTDVYSHPDCQQFLARIRERPDDDLPRLVCADWLDDQGEGERAEFIRVSIECAKCVDACGPGRVCREVRSAYGRTCASLRMRAEELFKDNVCRWLYGIVLPDVAYRLPWQPTGSEVPDDAYRVQFERGFQSSAYGQLASLHGRECVAACPETGNICHGGRTTAPNPAFTRECRSCHGTGRTNGVLAELLRREPIGCDGIEVTDRSPLETAVGSFVWNWTRMAGYDAPHIIPYEVFNAIEPRLNWGEFPTAGAARLAFSRALYSINAPKSEVSR